MSGRLAYLDEDIAGRFERDGECVWMAELWVYIERYPVLVVWLMLVVGMERKGGKGRARFDSPPTSMSLPTTPSKLLASRFAHLAYSPAKNKNAQASSSKLIVSPTKEDKRKQVSSDDLDSSDLDAEEQESVEGRADQDLRGDREIKKEEQPAILSASESYLQERESSPSVCLPSFVLPPVRRAHLCSLLSFQLLPFVSAQTKTLLLLLIIRLTTSIPNEEEILSSPSSTLR